MSLFILNHALPIFTFLNISKNIVMASSFVPKSYKIQQLAANKNVIKFMKNCLNNDAIHDFSVKPVLILRILIGFKAILKFFPKD